MARYMIEVIESRTYSMTYVVEADSPEEAETKAERGDTVEEIQGSIGEVLTRTLVSKPLAAS